VSIWWCADHKGLCHIEGFIQGRCHFPDLGSMPPTVWVCAKHPECGFTVNGKCRDCWIAFYGQPTAKPYPVLPPTHVSVPASRYPSVDTLWREPHPLDRTPPEGPCPIEDHLAGASCPRCHVPTPKAHRTSLPVELL
jgi:hypothetical protein